MSTNINYLNKDFQSSKQALLDFASVYFPKTYSSFSESDPAMMFIEMSAYISDILNFYIDKNVQENFIEYAQNKDSLLNMAYFSGYRPKITSTSTVDLSVYQIVPAKISGSIAEPDYDYCLTIEANAKIRSSSQSSIIFITRDEVDFAHNSIYDPTEISVYEINNYTNQPEYYLFKKKVKAVSGDIKSTDITVYEPEKFFTTTINDTDIVEILSIIDSDGNKWYEVPYLAQDTIVDYVKNDYINSPKTYQDYSNVPYLLKLKKIQRRFVSRYDSDDKLVLEFGSGVTTSVDEEIIPNTNNVGLGLVDGISKNLQAYDPSNFLYTGEYGLAPSYTTLSVRYITGGGLISNVPANDLTEKYEIIVKTPSLNIDSLNESLLNYVKKSLAFNNDNSASGGGDGDNIDDIRLKSIASFSTQMRSVNKDDHTIRAYSLPAKFGSIAKVYTSNSVDNGLDIDMYILSYDSNKRLIKSSDSLKMNLKNYLEQFRIMSDNIRIKDAYYINIGVNFSIMVSPSYNNKEVLSNCLQKIKGYFNIDKWTIGQPILINSIRKELSDVEGVQSVTNIEIVNKYGESKGYSKYGYDIQSATKMEIVYPSKDKAIFEVRYPDMDINGKITTI